MEARSCPSRGTWELTGWHSTLDCCGDRCGVRVLLITQAGVPVPGARQQRSLGGNPKTLSSPTFQGLTAWGSAAQAGSQGKFSFPQHLPC